MAADGCRERRPAGCDSFRTRRPAYAAAAAVCDRRPRLPLFRDSVVVVVFVCRLCVSERTRPWAHRERKRTRNKGKHRNNTQSRVEFSKTIVVPKVVTRSPVPVQHYNCIAVVARYVVFLSVITRAAAQQSHAPQIKR